MSFSAPRSSRAGPAPDFLYLEHPVDDIDLEEFERFSLNRLEVLKYIENLSMKGLPEEELLNKTFTKYQDLVPTEEGTPDPHRQDRIGHFALRIAFCDIEDRRRWFVTHETILFRARLRRQSDKVGMLHKFDIPFRRLERLEFTQLRSRLADMCRSNGDNDLAQRCLITPLEQEFFRGPFIRVPDLVGSRSVLVVKGEAILHKDQVTSLVALEFRVRLSHQISLMGPKWNAFSGIKAEEADRLVRLTQGLHSREDGEDFSKKAGVAITAAEVPILARKHFPLCMYTMHHRLEKENQRRFMYDARQQYGLFLKAAGLPIEQALLFWRTMYARRGLNEEQFNKEYAYAIRHNYGKEGKRTDYTPFSCSRIVASGGQDVDKVHGCPYKYLVGKAGTVTAASHHRTKPLEDALVKFGISASEATTVAAKAAEGHPQLACGLAFQCKTGCVSEGVSHPNSYYRASVDAAAGVAEAEPVTPPMDHKAVSRTQITPPSRGL